MAKAKSQFICQACGTAHVRWGGKCEGCGEWDSLVEEAVESSVPKGMSKGKGTVVNLSRLDETLDTPPRYATGMAELDRVLGGGLVQGGAVLIGGDPGIGKSTLLLQLVAALAKQNHRAMYFSGEESLAQIQMRAVRLGLADAPVELGTANSVRDIIASLDKSGGVDVVIIDSIQTMFVDNIDSAPGTVSQVRASANELVRYAKKRNIAMILVGHVTKDGQIAGPRVLEHMVDCVLYFEGERGHVFRILRTVKNRFGATDEIGVFEMMGSGLQEVANPSSLFLSERDEAVSGSAVFAGMEGTRPVLSEIQALVSNSNMATPRRAVVGWDSARLAMVLAVLESRAGVKFSDREVYLNVTGGLKIAEPAADAAVAAALLSAVFDTALPSSSVFFGEIGLSGEVRAVSRQPLRLKETEKLGFKRAYGPPLRSKGDKSADLSLGITPLNHVEDIAALVRACG